MDRSLGENSSESIDSCPENDDIAQLIHEDNQSPIEKMTPTLNIPRSLMQPGASVCTVIAEGTPEDETDSILQRDLSSRLESRLSEHRNKLSASKNIKIPVVSEKLSGNRRLKSSKIKVDGFN